MLVAARPEHPLCHSDSMVWESWFRAMAASDYGFGVEVRRFESSTAFAVQELPVTVFNKVMGLVPDTPTHIDELVGFYRGRKLPCRIDINPFAQRYPVLERLRTLGFVPAEIHVTLQGRVQPPSAWPPSGHLSVEPVEKDSIEEFSQLYAQAYHEGGKAPFPKRIIEFRAASIVARCDLPDWRLYLVKFEGEPAGGALLHLGPEVATLAGGATLRRFRGMGVQTELIRHRIAAAGQAGCSTVASRCVAGSKSQSNLQRAGLRVAYHKTIWEPEPF